MNEIIVDATGLPLKFPDPRQEAYERAQEFRRLTPEERWREIAALMHLGLKLTHASPRRLAIERSWEAEEAEWHRLQKELFAQHG